MFYLHHRCRVSLLKLYTSIWMYCTCPVYIYINPIWWMYTYMYKDKQGRAVSALLTCQIFGNKEKKIWKIHMWYVSSINHVLNCSYLDIGKKISLNLISHLQIGRRDQSGKLRNMSIRRLPLAAWNSSSVQRIFQAPRYDSLDVPSVTLKRSLPLWTMPFAQDELVLEELESCKKGSIQRFPTLALIWN